ncbi:endophilin-B1 isoform X3 [Vespula pensylvanica]|uniref:endophilin-B1 isoform X3 n=1 Tax=Vespula pensylvanica TaxID=30213 RepID=UPI001CBA177E|nr:endophilin-B1 isoform X3 [Vespula pensylvanica]XP_050863900.1 endophilin-B1 isoform X3 [Vespula vulgaris]
MDFNVKKLVKDAGAALSRVVQLTEETLGTSEKTELDAHLEHLAERANATKTWTEKVLRNMEAVLTPNPGNRIEDFFYEKIDKKKPNRLSNLEYVGIDMIEAGNDFGPGIAYGSALIKVGQCQQKLGQIERDFIGIAANCYIQPLRKFLDGEMKTVSKEMAILETKRLDLDACKNRVRKARSMLGQQSDSGVSPEVLLDQAERELRVAQSEFDRQAEIVKLLLEGVSSSQAGHLRCLHEFVEAQARHYAQCHATMQELQRELAGLSGGPYHSTTSTNPTAQVENGQDRARVVCDYDARDSTELSVMQDEVISIIEIPGDEDYLIGIRGNQRGKVPKAYLETILSY